MQAEHFNNKEGLIEYNVNCFRETLAQVFQRPPLRKVTIIAFPSNFLLPLFRREAIRVIGFARAALRRATAKVFLPAPLSYFSLRTRSMAQKFVGLLQVPRAQHLCRLCAVVIPAAGFLGVSLRDGTEHLLPLADVSHNGFPFRDSASLQMVLCRLLLPPQTSPIPGRFLLFVPLPCLRS